MIETSPEKGESIGTLSLQQNYRELRFHAKGGLGEIYIADDSDLSREVALKFIRARHRNRRDSMEQFRLEAEITARLDHPGIVPVYSTGKTPDGRHCYAMRFIQGDTLESTITDIHSRGGTEHSSLFSAVNSVELRQLIAKFITVCQTIAYAHNRGILHRDIKPDNIMLGRFGETLVVDWGLALAINRDDTARASGEETLMPAGGSGSSSGSTGGAVGTPAYMSPEQAAGLPKLTPSADIFSLGATLYKLLTGQAPYRGDSARETLARAQAATWVPPQTIKEEIPAGLDAICRKALSASREQRYQTALDFADDLENWLADEPIQAMPENTLQRAGRWMRKHRGAAQWIITIILLTLVSLAIVVTTDVVQSRELVQQRVNFLETQGNFKEMIIKSAFEDLRNDVRLLAGRPVVREAAVAFQRLPLPEPVGDNGRVPELKQDIALLFREVLAQNPSYMQVRYLANDASGSEKIRLDRRERNGTPFEIQKSLLQGKRGNAYFDRTVTLGPGQVYLSDININRENEKRQWQFPVVRAAAPVLSPDGRECLGIVVVNMHFGHVLEKMEQAATDDLQVYLTDHEGRFLAFPGNADVPFCSYRGLDFSLEMLFEDLSSFRSRERESIRVLQATANPSILISAKSAAPTKVLMQALEESIPSETYDRLEVLTTEYDAADAFSLQDSEKSGNDARPMAVLSGKNWSPGQVVEQIESSLERNYSVTLLPVLQTSTDHALYCRKISLSDLTDDRDRYLCLLLVLPHSARIDLN